MSKKVKTKGYNYYKEFIAVSNLIVKASQMLNDTLQDFDLKSLEKKLVKLNEVERTADNLKYEMMEFMYSDFLPPIEREDIRPPNQQSRNARRISTGANLRRRLEA